MAQRLDHEKRNRRTQKGEGLAAEIDEDHTLRAAAAMAKSSEQLAQIRELLEEHGDEVTEAQSRFLKNAYLWMLTHPDKQLARYHRSRLARIRKYLRLRRLGVPLTREQRKNWRPPYREKFGSRWPSWLQGKKPKLPQRPPQKHRSNDEETD